MEPSPFALLATLARDSANGWSIGSFGAIGEFVRDADEPVEIDERADRIALVTARGALRIDQDPTRTGVAWDSLSADGESWGHTLAFCHPRPASPPRMVRAIGADRDAIRPQDADALLFDLGVGSGCVAFCVRTADPALIAVLRAAEAQPLLEANGIMPAMLAAQPNRVLLAPSARIEVYQPIPPADGTSPIGPHTHVLPKLIAQDRAHSANVPIPEGWQATLSLHPRSPWRTVTGERHPFDPAIDMAFAPLLARFGLADDRTVADTLVAAIATTEPSDAAWPDTRRGRTKARIVLRRLAAAGDARVKPWRARYDRGAIDSEEGDVS